MKKIIFCIMTLVVSINIQAQNKFFTKNGKIYFNATVPSSPDKIEATNQKATSIIDVSTGAIEFAVLMKAFAFEKALMQEHFHENYMESDKFPKATFKGNIADIKSVDLKKNGTYPVKVKGMMTMHGETKEVTAEGSLTVKDGNITAGKSQFKVLLEDFKIEIPSIVKDKIAREAIIDVDLNFEPYKSS